MRVGVRSFLASGKICKAMPLWVLTVAMVIPGNAVAFSQSATGSQAPIFTAIDLRPSGFFNSSASGISGGQVVGNGTPDNGSVDHMLLWRGSAASVVDLHPAGFTDSAATATSGGQQVGYGTGQSTRGQTHALLWRGSAAAWWTSTPAGLPNLRRSASPATSRWDLVVVRLLGA